MPLFNNVILDEFIMRRERRKKRAITLIEIMIVILLIGLIGGALAYNMRGSLEEGRAFKTRQNKSRLYDLLMLEYAQGDRNLKEIADQWSHIIKQSPLVKGDDLLKDGWNEPFRVEVSIEYDDLIITSNKLTVFDARKQPSQTQ